MNSANKLITENLKRWMEATPALSSQTAVARAAHCPSTGKPKGACPGFIIDHVVPLACGGPDTPANMQWQTVKDAKAKDKLERRDCSH